MSYVVLDLLRPKSQVMAMSQDIVLSLALGVGLAAAVGFRVFLPLFIYGLAVHEGVLSASVGFEWASTTPALFMFAVAGTIEIVAYYVPLLDNALDTVAGPLAVAAGICVVAAALGDAPPMLKWALAIIAGGGVAAVTQGASTALRGVSTATTAGLGNHLISTGEIFGAIGLSLVAILLPYVALVAVVVLAIIILWVFLRRWKKSTNGRSAKA